MYIFLEPLNPRLPIVRNNQINLCDETLSKILGPKNLSEKVLLSKMLGQKICPKSFSFPSETSIRK
jgi:hypothetical protein